MLRYNEIKCFISICWQNKFSKFSGAKLSVFKLLVPNCPGAKLSGYQIVRFELLVPNCLFFTLGAKLSVLSLDAILSGCQDVRFLLLVPNCPTMIICEPTFAIDSGWILHTCTCTSQNEPPKDFLSSS